MYNRIEICGAIASGKSSLANAFSKLSQNIIFEDFTKIAMLDDFYANPASFSFETEIAFTLQHYYQLKKSHNVDEVAFSDFSIVGDYAFALVTLNEREMHIYRQILEYIRNEMGTPQKLIRLRTSTQTLLMRINKRGRQNEQNISKEYLLEIENGIDIAIKNIYGDVPIFEINTDKYGLTDYSLDFLKSIAD